MQVGWIELELGLWAEVREKKQKKCPLQVTNEHLRGIKVRFRNSNSKRLLLSDANM